MLFLVPRIVIMLTNVVYDIQVENMHFAGGTPIRIRRGVTRESTHDLSKN